MLVCFVLFLIFSCVFFLLEGGGGADGKALLVFQVKYALAPFCFYVVLFLFLRVYNFGAAQIL